MNVTEQQEYDKHKSDVEQMAVMWQQDLNQLAFELADKVYMDHASTVTHYQFAIKWHIGDDAPILAEDSWNDVEKLINSWLVCCPDEIRGILEKFKSEHSA